MLGVLRTISRTNSIRNFDSLIKVKQINPQFVRFNHNHTTKMAKALVIVADGSEEMEAVGRKQDKI